MRAISAYSDSSAGWRFRDEGVLVLAIHPRIGRPAAHGAAPPLARVLGQSASALASLVDVPPVLLRPSGGRGSLRMARTGGRTRLATCPHLGGWGLGNHFRVPA